MRPNLATLVDEFRLHSADTAVVAHRGNRAYRTTYGELATLTGRFSAELARRNIAPGDRVVIWGANSAEWIAAFFGCILRAVIAVPLDAAGSPEFAARIIRDVSPKLILGDPHLLASLPLDDTPKLALATLADHLPADPLFTPSDAIQPHTPFQIVFTSGTTSDPRGIVHTHRNILVSLQPIENEMQKYLKYERPFHPLRFLHLLPLSHVFGQFMGLWCPALLGAEVHFAEEFEPARLVELIRRERISVLIAVPRVLTLLRTHLLTRFPELAGQLNPAGAPFVTASPSRVGSKGPNPILAILKKWFRFRRIHSALGWKFWAVISGGATLPAELEAFWNRLGFALIQGYGMTETAALVTLNHPFHIKQGSIGRPLPGRDVQISPDGEILVRGDMLTGATWQGGQMHKREGEWLATGDLAATSASGELKFLGRKGDVIVTSAGLNIHPADLETALTAQPGIRAAAVVACDLNAGPEPVAVVLTTLSSAEIQSAVDAANRTLAEFQQIRRVLRWPELQFPSTTTGKLIRRQVAAWACATLTGNRAESIAPTRDSLLAVIAEVTGEPIPTTPDPNALRLSEDLHLDSLGRVQLQSALEQRFSLELEDDAIASVATIADLRAQMELSVVSSQLPVESPLPTPTQPPATNTQQPATVSQLTTDNRELTTDHLYPRWPWSRPIQLLRTLWIELIMRPLVWLLAAPRVTCAAPLDLCHSRRESASVIVPNLEPLLIISNHITAYDGAFVLYALPPHLRHRIAAAMSGEMLLDFRARRNQGNWFLNALAPAAYYLLTALFNVFPLPHARGFRRSFAHAGEAMDRGYSVLIFPEGTRSRIGRMNPLRPGIGLLAQQSRVPILPIALVGLYDFEPRTSNPEPKPWFHSGQIEIRVGAIIPAPTEDADPAALTTQLEQALRTLLSRAKE
jgi:long-chain acyl-CoA synthetase